MMAEMAVMTRTLTARNKKTRFMIGMPPVGDSFYKIRRASTSLPERPRETLDRPGNPATAGLVLRPRLRGPVRHAAAVAVGARLRPPLAAFRPHLPSAGPSLLGFAQGEAVVTGDLAPAVPGAP